MKNLLSLTLSILMIIILLTSCADTEAVKNPSTSDEYDFTDTTLPEKKNVTYPVVYTAIDEIEYDTTNVLGTAQIEDKLYLLEPNGVHMVNLADGTISKVFEKEGLMFIASHETELYVTDTISVYTLDPSGVLINTQQIPEGTFDKAHFEYNTAFISTDDYFVFACPYDKLQTHIYVSKADMSVTVNEKHMQYTICSYEGNKYWTHDMNNEGEGDVVCYDIDTGKKGEKYDVDVYLFDMEYDIHSGNFVFYSSGSSVYGMEILEFNPEDGSIKQLVIYPSEKSPKTICLTVCGNIYCAVSDNISKINTYDMQRVYNTVNIAVLGYTTPEMEYLTYVLKETHNINVNIIQIDFKNKKHLPLKLMAGDTDIDLFYTEGVDLPYYIKNSCFMDLNQFGELSENIGTCQELLNCGYTYEGQLFGIPYEASGPIVVDCMQTVKIGSYDRANNTLAYQVKYMNLMENSYTDDGDMLYDFLKHCYDNKDSGPFGIFGRSFDLDIYEPLSEDVYVVNGDCYVMNPSALNVEESVIFLNELMNLGFGHTYDGLEEYFYSDRNIYYDLEFDYSKAYPGWIAENLTIVTELSSAIKEAKNAEKKSELRSIAKEYYNRLRQIIME